MPQVKNALPYRPYHARPLRPVGRSRKHQEKSRNVAFFLLISAELRRHQGARTAGVNKEISEESNEPRAPDPTAWSGPGRPRYPLWRHRHLGGRGGDAL